MTSTQPIGEVNLTVLLQHKVSNCFIRVCNYGCADFAGKAKSTMENE